MQPKDITARHFRGINTVEDLKARCLIDDFTGCWHWQGAMRTDRYGKRTPALWIFDTRKGKFRTMTGPMAVLELEGARKPRFTIGWRMCRCDACLNPAHILGGTRAEFGAWMRLHGHWKNVPARVAANRRAARERAFLTPEIAERIRTSPLNGLEAAAEFGVSPQQVSKVRTGRSWANTVVAGASVFTLGAR
jgi:hypothetical protein